MGHDRPDHPLISSQDKKELSPSPLDPNIIRNSENYTKTLEARIDSLTDQLRNFKMGTAIGTVTILSMWAFSATNMNTSGVFIIGILDLVFLLFISEVLDIASVSERLKELWGRIMPPRK